MSETQTGRTRASLNDLLDTRIYDVEPPEQNEYWYRWQNRQVRNRTACRSCAGSIPESDEYSWKYAQAGGCLAGPFCSRECYWTFMNEDGGSDD